MDLFNILSLLGGLALFLFGMSTMSSAMEKSAGNKLNVFIGKLTSTPLKCFTLGLIATVLVQSSSASTVMVVGFVNSGVMTLKQSVDIIIGANVGAAGTFWLTSLSGITGGGWLLRLFKPTSLASIFGLIGIGMYMFGKRQRRKDTGMICLGFAILMFGMNIMADAVEPLAEMPQFSEMFRKLSNPLLGLAVGVGFTALIQSSSASVGILQALAMTGSITFASAVPIMAGQNIGTCITAMMSSIGTGREGRRSALVHLYYNILSAIVWLICFYAADALFGFSFLEQPIHPAEIALVQTISKLFGALVFYPFHGLLQKLAITSVPEKKEDEEFALLDERLFATPMFAITHADQLCRIMSDKARESMFRAMHLINHYEQYEDDKVLELEDRIDAYEDRIGTYLVHLSSHAMNDQDSRELTKLLHMLNDFERISDHAVNITESARELSQKGIGFSEDARVEIDAICKAVHDILDISIDAFQTDDISLARRVEPLEETVDTLRDRIKARHIERLKNGECTIEMGFVLTDLLTSLERVADHCSNIAVCVMEVSAQRFDGHTYEHAVKAQEGFEDAYEQTLTEYLPESMRE